MDIELDIALEGNGKRKYMCRAIVKDVPPEEFGPYIPVDEFAGQIQPVGTMLWQVWQANSKIIVHARVVPSPPEVQIAELNECGSSWPRVPDMSKCLICRNGAPPAERLGLHGGPCPSCGHCHYCHRPSLDD